MANGGAERGRGGDDAGRQASAPSPLRLAALLVGAQVCLASLMVVGREALASIPPNAIAAARLVGGSAVFLLLARTSPRAPVRSDDRWLIVLCGALGAANQLFFLNGLAMSTAASASILSTTIPVFTGVAAWAFRLERPRAQHVVGMAVALTGALVLLGVDRLSGERRYLAGNLLILANCGSWAAFLVLTRRLASRYPPMLLAARLFSVGALLCLPLCLPAVMAFAPRCSPTEALYLVFIVAVPTVGAYGLNQMALPHAGSSVVATYWYLLPVLGALGAVIRLGERPGLRAGAAAACICAGVFLSSRSAPLPPGEADARSSARGPPWGVLR